MHRTLQDYIDDAGGIEAMGRAGDPLLRRLHPNGDAPRPLFQCACGRLVDTENMLDLEPGHVAAAVRLTPAQRSAIGSAHRFGCDGCWTGWVRQQRLDATTLRRATGQPHTGAPKSW